VCYLSHAIMNIFHRRNEEPHILIFRLKEVN